MMPPGPDQTETPLHYTRGFEPEAAAHVLPAWGQRDDVLPAAPFPDCAGAPRLLWQPLGTASHVRLLRHRVGLAAPGPGSTPVTRCYPSLPTSPHRYTSRGRGQGMPVPIGAVHAPTARPCPPGARRLPLCARGRGLRSSISFLLTPS